MPKILHMHKKVIDDIVVSYEEIVDTSCLLSYYYRNKQDMRNWYQKLYMLLFWWLNLNNIKIDKKSYRNILVYYVGYVTPSMLKSLAGCLSWMLDVSLA